MLSITLCSSDPKYETDNIDKVEIVDCRLASDATIDEYIDLVVRALEAVSFDRETIFKGMDTFLDEAEYYNDDEECKCIDIDEEINDD